jgi:hypothetical protein
MKDVWERSCSFSHRARFAVGETEKGTDVRVNSAARQFGGMARIFGICSAGLGLLVLSCLAGCSQYGRIYPPKIDASRAAEAAIKLYDSDGDGILSAGELERAPGLRASLCDTNKDGRITADEIIERINKYQSDRVGLISFEVHVTLNDKPLKGATVKFIPEEFLSDWIQPGSGTTDANGLAFIGMDPSLLRQDLKSMPLMHCGIYRVEITQPQTSIPARYNTNTVIGQEIAADTIVNPYNPIPLKSP